MIKRSAGPKIRIEVEESKTFISECYGDYKAPTSRESKMDHGYVWNSFE